MVKPNFEKANALLAREGFFVQPQWLQECICFLESELDSQVPEENWMFHIAQQYLYSDLTEISSPIQKNNLSFVICQVLESIDVTQSMYSQLSSFLNKENRDEKSKSNRQLKIRVTDGKEEVFLLEFHAGISSLPSELPYGCKIRVRKGLEKVNEFFLIKKSDDVQVLGGVVSEKAVHPVHRWRRKLNIDESNGSKFTVNDDEIPLKNPFHLSSTSKRPASPNLPPKSIERPGEIVIDDDDEWDEEFL
ncbi:hypothetical protein ROZALSC1DRAFT_30543, partial [Rozella allomycis CSF55]